MSGPNVSFGCCEMVILILDLYREIGPSDFAPVLYTAKSDTYLHIQQHFRKTYNETFTLGPKITRVHEKASLTGFPTKQHQASILDLYREIGPSDLAPVLCTAKLDTYLHILQHFRKTYNGTFTLGSKITGIHENPSFC